MCVSLSPSSGFYSQHCKCRTARQRKAVPSKVAGRHGTRTSKAGKRRKRKKSLVEEELDASRYMESDIYEQFCGAHLVKSLTLLRKREANLLAQDLAALEALQYHYTESISFLYEAALNIDDEEVLQTVLAWKEDPAGLVQRLRGYEALLGEANALYILRRQPELALLSPELLADRLLQLRYELPTANLIATIRQYPWILLLCMKGNADLAFQLRAACRVLQNSIPRLCIQQTEVCHAVDVAKVQAYDSAGSLIFTQSFRKQYSASGKLVRIADLQRHWKLLDAGFEPFLNL